MAAGEARRLHRTTGKRVVIVDRAGRPQWSELWDGLPYIARERRPDFICLINASGVRPYIVGKTPLKWTWRPYQPHPAELAFTPAELAFAEPYRGTVLIEPHVKNTGHQNKAWFWDRWQALVDYLPMVDFVQCLQPGARGLDGVKHLATPTFRHALAVLSVCKAFVTTEGGLMHGGAAVGVPGVILWSEFISPEITGYAMHRNLRHAGAACGKRINCHACRASMQAISVREVADALRQTLADQSQPAKESA